MTAETKSRIAIFASGKGTNAEAIIRHFIGHRRISVGMVLSNRAEAGVLERAKANGVLSRVFNKEQFQDGTVLSWLREDQVTHIVLAGFLWLIPETILRAFPDRIINIHPALLPKFGGKGMYGSRVHEAVLSAGETETGISIHLLNERFDEGRILFQASCEVTPGDSAHSISEKVASLEHKHYPEVVEKWITST